MGYTVDIDTGGTFTDGFFVKADRVQTVKVPTTPHDLTVCFLECLKAGADRFGIPVEDLLYETDIIRFSSTIGTNTIIQRDGAKIGLMLSAGSEKLAPTQSENGKSPLVSADMVIAIDEEVSEDGEIIRSPDERAAMSAAQKLIDQGARCLVVAFRQSEVNPANEQLARRIIKEEYPRDFLGSVPVFLSSDISRRSGDAERVNAAVINAYIHSKLVRLLYKAGEDLRRRLYRRNLFIVHNNGAVARVAKTRAINTYNSGPAAGLLGARLIAELYGAENVISIDMGGTSFDVGYVRKGQPSYTLTAEVEGLAVNLPMLAIHGIGAGGGSIASVKNGRLQVGPQSAGALPGPVCFDLGGTEPTVTDADLILGLLNPGYFLGGAMKLNREKAAQVMDQNIAKPLGISVQSAALAVKNTVDETMGKEVAKVVQEMGFEANPLLVVYGGAGPAHCCRLSQVASIKRILIAPFSAVFSAFSSSNMDVGHIYYRRAGIPLDEKMDMQALHRAFDEMRREAQRDMRGEGFSSEGGLELLEFFVQNTSTGKEMKFTAPCDTLDEAKKMADLLSQARHALKADKGLMLTTLALISQAPVPHYQIREMPEAAYPVDKARKGSRSVLLDEKDGAKEIPVYDWSKLQNGHEIPGPAVIESEHTTALVRAGWKLGMDHYGHALLEEVG